MPGALVKVLAVTLENGYSILNKMPEFNKEKINELAAANRVCNIDKAKRELGFNPLYNLERGVHASFNWYKKNWL